MSLHDVRSSLVSVIRGRRRGRRRGFSHVTQTIEAAAVMGWFVILVLGEKYLGDATASRRSAEVSVQESVVASAMGECGGGSGLGAGLGNLGSAAGVAQNLLAGGGRVPVSANLDIGGNGAPKLTLGSIPQLIMGLGLGKLPTLPIYSKSFQRSNARASAGAVTAAAPLNFRSGNFQASRSMACLEPSLDSPGAPWVNIKASRTLIFITTILGYR